MKCWSCRNIDLIWGGDHDAETDEGEEFIITNLHCPECQAEVFVHHGSRDKFTPDWVDAMEIPELDLH